MENFDNVTSETKSNDAKLNEAKANARDAKQDFGRAAQNVQRDVASGAKDMAQDMRDAKQDTKGGAQNLKQDVADSAKELKQDAQSGAKNVAQNVKSAAQNVGENIKGGVQDLKGSIEKGADQMMSGNAPAAHREGPLTRLIEYQTARLPSDTFLFAAIGSIGLSLVLEARGRERLANFVGQWVPTFLLFGIYNKIVKVAGSDRLESNRSLFAGGMETRDRRGERSDYFGSVH